MIKLSVTMKSFILALLSAASVLFVLGLFTACTGTASESYTYNVTTGDNIKVKLDITEGYSLRAELPFVISHDGEKLSEGTFVYAEAYQQYVDVVNRSDGVDLLDQGTKDGNEYIFWCYNNSEYNYAILIKGSNTAILLGNPISRESAEECFSRLTIILEE